jgi:thiamine-phosphate pyrophosphorylase
VSGVSRILNDLTAQLGATVRREKADMVRGLYVIIDPQVTGGRDPFAIARAAIQGGARMLQLRDKLRDKGESLPLAHDLQKLCVEAGASLILNDHADVAAIVGAAGLHVGQTDLPVEQARQVLAPHQVLGRSNHEIEELVESERIGADHVAFGAIYHTDTKGVGRSPQGIERLLLARDAAQTPLVAIGGITAENAAPVIEAGVDAICVTAAVGSAAEPEAAAAKLVKVIEEAGGRI